MKTKSQAPDLKKLLDKWKKILRLQDWDFDIAYGDLHEVKRDAAAHSQTNTYHGTCVIRVLSLEDFLKEKDFCIGFDPERSIVHELLHIYFVKAFPSGEHTNNEELEHSINMLTKALLTLDRGK